MTATSATDPSPKSPKPAGRSLGRFVMVLLGMPAWWIAVFASAGRIGWVRGWIWLGSFFVAMGSASLLVRLKNRALMEARSSFRFEGTKPFDKVFIPIFFLLISLQPIVAGLDAVRFGWSSMPFVTVYFGVALLVLGLVPVTWAMLVNPFAEATVRIQRERGHKAVTTGPYRIVRHPMYFGFLLMYPAMALILGSVWALAVSGLIAIAVVWRTAREDQTLRAELPGYEELAAVTRYRLIPGLW